MNEAVAGVVTGQGLYVALSYAAFALGVLGLVLWVVLPARKQRRLLARLERDQEQDVRRDR